MDHWISEEAEVGAGTEIGRGAIVEAGAVIGRDCRIGHYVVIHRDVRIGDAVRIDDGAVLGKEPMRAAISILKPEDKLSPMRLGDGCIVGTGAVLYRGAKIGKKVMVADLATVREHTSVGDFTIIGRGATVENFCEVGRYCKLETECYLTAYSVLEDRVFIAPQVTTSNDNFVGRTRERLKHFKGVTVRKGGRIGGDAGRAGAQGRDGVSGEGIEEGAGGAVVGESGVGVKRKT